MSHFGRSGPPDISDTYSLLVLNITFRTTADDLFPLFDKYGKVVDIFIPKDRRTGESRGFAFVRYKYADEAQKAVDRLDGRMVDGREITVQFAKYGPNAERIIPCGSGDVASHKGRIIETAQRSRHRSRSRSPRKRYRDDRDRDYRKRSRSRSYDRYERDKHRGRDKDYHHRSRSRSTSLDYKGRGRARYDDEHHSRSRSRSVDSRSPSRRSPSPRKSPSLQRSASPQRSTSPRKSPRGESPANRSRDGRSPSPRSVSPRGRPEVSRSPSPRNSNGDVSNLSECSNEIFTNFLVNKAHVGIVAVDAVSMSLMIGREFDAGCKNMLI
ncbi:hypothetical protein V8G54_005229 [Vigna mungo]|uniref:RRM domain-containing protein n=1 Tax=Vigna mungo TaxID=3915 RepID=A0AAQ3PDP5_VIGMU